MKDSGIEWIGEIPEHWGLERAKFLFRQSTSKGNERLVLLSATQDRGVIDKSNLEGVVQVSANADLNLFKTVHINDFVISLRSFQGGFEIAKEEGVISPAYTVFRMTQQTYPHFYRYLFKCNSFIDKINSLTVGIREGKNIQYEDFANMLIPQIDEAEQQSIVNHLDWKCAEIDNLISLQEEMIAELKAYKQSVITEAVCKGLDKNLPMKDSGVEWIGEIPKDWSLLPIKRSYKIYNGSTPKSDKKEYWDGDIVWVTPVDMYENTYINQSNKTITEIGYNSCGTTLIPINSVILSTRAPIGQVCLNMVELCTNQGCKSLVPDEKSYSKYLMYYLMIQTNVLNMYGRGTTFLELSTNNLANFIMPFPSLSEQQSIANYLDKKCANIDQLISIKQQKAVELKEYKKSMIYEYVTGKKEVI